MANELINILQSQLNNPQLMQQLSQQIGEANPEKTQQAASGIVTTLLSAMARNAAQPKGASALTHALDQDHDGSILDDAIGLLSQQQGSNKAQRMLNGTGILSHLLGGKQNDTTQMISQMSGLNPQKTDSLMTLLAPLIMGAVGKTKRQESLDATGLFNLLSGTLQQQKQAQGNANQDMISRLLDQDGDGEIADDALRIGGNLLKRFLNRKK